MGMLWERRWESLPFEEYFGLPYDKFESGRPAVIVRPLGPMNKGMIATGNHIDLYSLRGAPPDSLHCRKIASGANRRLSFLSTGCHGAVEKTTGAEALQRLPPGEAFWHSRASA